MASPDHGRVRELFHQAVELKEEARAAFLRKACGSDDALRSAVERLLRNHFPETLLLESEQRDQPDSRAPRPTGSGTQKFGDTVAEDLSHSSVGRLRRESQSLPSFYKGKWPFFAAGVISLTLLSFIGAWCYSAIRSATATTVERGMAGLLDQQVYAIESWLQAEERVVQSWVRAPGIVAAVRELDKIARAEKSPGEALAASATSAELSEQLQSQSVDNVKYEFAVWNREGTLIADSSPQNARFLGNGTTEYGGSIMARVFNGETVLWMPSREGFITRDFELPDEITQPGLALITPIVESDGRSIAAMLLFSFRWQHRFQELLKRGWLGDTDRSTSLAKMVT